MTPPAGVADRIISTLDTLGPMLALGGVAGTFLVVAGGGTRSATAGPHPGHLAARPVARTSPLGVRSDHAPRRPARRRRRALDRPGPRATSRRRCEHDLLPRPRGAGGGPAATPRRHPHRAGRRRPAADAERWRAPGSLGPLPRDHHRHRRGRVRKARSGPDRVRLAPHVLARHPARRSRWCGGRGLGRVAGGPSPGRAGADRHGPPDRVDGKPRARVHARRT